MIYVGAGLRSASGAMVEPALIDPRLSVDHHRPDWNGSSLDYWPSYTMISPQARAAYLTWLADGRRVPNIPIGYVFLYFYGLERRVLYDLNMDRSRAMPEMPVILHEVRRLLNIYGRHSSFRRYAGRFEEVLELVNGDGIAIGDAPAPSRDYPPSMRLRIGLGEFATRGEPLPASWAFSWICSHPEYYPRTPATRCAEQFKVLFERRYADRHGRGLVLRPGQKRIALDYRPASAGFRGVAELTLPSTPDVITAAGPTRKLAALADECTSALDPYSRFIGRYPDAETDIQAQALLPSELIDLTKGEPGRAVAWARNRLGTADMAVAPAAEFMAWISAQDAKPGKRDAVSLARILDAASIGVEPDPRLGGPTPSAGSVVLFAAPGGPTAAPSDAYQAATLLLHLAAAVSAADSDFSAAEQLHLSEHLERALHLTVDERRRLHAHLRWLLTNSVKLTGLTKRIAVLDETQRANIGAFLAGVATADGVVSVSEIKTLTRIYRLLELDDAPIRSLSPTATPPTPRPATTPITVRPAAPESGFAIPPPAHEAVPPAVHLNQAVIAAKLAETAQVGALLGSIFTDEDEIPQPPPPPPAADPVAGLDGRHSALVRALKGITQLSRGQFEDLAARWSLLPDGALDRVNEAAFDYAGEPLLEGDDPVWVNRSLLGELLT
ncbi:TerB N-terminal domain-containing protein [Acrocarpospora macrocephala]|uniref:Tellurite resistance protein TerB n=1 Tax=Acrocarpospora macrocephala TaxID=150177 RepID=A0A5M3X6G9_9ACTN|nr:hypothetical protein Amac_102620 [Acrocarpospora macrocephala]